MLQSDLFRAKLRAFAWHFVATFCVAILGGVLIYVVWFPNSLAGYLGGAELYKLVLMVELGVGPLMSLVIFNPEKPRSELIRDYTFVSIVQIAALCYGLFAVAESRPVYEVFVKDRIEIVAAIEIYEEDYAAATQSGYSDATYLGPKRVCVDHPENSEEKSFLLFSAIGGKDIQTYPRYYRPCNEGEILKRAADGQRLKSIADFKDLAVILPSGDFKWLPVKHRFGAFVEVYPQNDISKAYYLDINPFE